jgi:mRNA-degrading endonuclease YafQ of YafQ-DinJ toxin-antitoxin module
MEITFSPSFVRTFKNLPKDFQREISEKISLFRNVDNHKALRVHKLSGRLKDRYSFSINYKIRIIFRYLPTEPKEAFLMAIGDHDIYNG